MKRSGDLFGPLPVTVVGSYPEAPSPVEMMRAFYSQGDPYLGPLERSVKAQLECGVDIISDGQTRADMISLFASGLTGVRMKGRPVVIGELELARPITLSDTLLTRRMVAERKSVARVKGIVTGPYTMALSVVDEHYGDVRELAFAMAGVLNKEARALSRHVDIIQFDEPFMSQDFPEYAAELISTATQGLDCFVALHSCGDVSALFDRYVELKVDLLDHEFATNPGLIDVVTDTDFDQNIGLGVVRSDSMKLERLEDVQRLVNRAVDRFGPDRVMLDPDCGLKHLSGPVARKKLELVVRARDIRAGTDRDAGPPN